MQVTYVIAGKTATTGEYRPVKLSQDRVYHGEPNKHTQSTTLAYAAKQLANCNAALAAMIAGYEADARAIPNAASSYADIIDALRGMDLKIATIKTNYDEL